MVDGIKALGTTTRAAYASLLMHRFLHASSAGNADCLEARNDSSALCARISAASLLRLPEVDRQHMLRCTVET